MATTTVTIRVEHDQDGQPDDWHLSNVVVAAGEVLGYGHRSGRARSGGGQLGVSFAWSLETETAP